MAGLTRLALPPSPRRAVTLVAGQLLRCEMFPGIEVDVAALFRQPEGAAYNVKMAGRMSSSFSGG